MSDNQREFLIELLKENKEIPEDFKHLLFPTTQKEYELAYAGKMRKEDILANEDGVFPVPIQREKIFNNDSKIVANNNDWYNIIAFGDNLQFLKTIYENKDPIIKDKIKGKVKLIYIDPPFATEGDFNSNENQKAYSDKKKGSEFIEFLRKRLTFAKEILSDDGSLFVHLDWRKAHYIKIVLDEIFGESRFTGDIIWHYFTGVRTMKYFNRKHDIILWYTKSENFLFNQQYDIRMLPYKPSLIDKDGNISFIECKTCKKESGVFQSKVRSGDVWDIQQVFNMSSQYTSYPTQKPEELLQKIICACSNDGDIVMDFFGGSGTTMAVAEKLNRKWITCDLGKLAYFTMQKRLLQIEDSKDLNDPKNKYGKKARPFLTCTLGIYDLNKALTLEWENYLEFVRNLFEVELIHKKISGYEFDGIKDNYYVKIWDYNKHKDSNVDENYLKSVHQIISGKVSGRVYIIAPANSIDFIADYYEIDDIRYYFLKIPYQVIRELHKIPFQKIRQPQSKNNVNDLDEVIGFHFIKAPEVKTSVKKEIDKIFINIKEFKSQYYKDEDGKIIENFETLSAVFIDRKYDGEKFVMTDSFFADELLPNRKTQNDIEDVREELKLLKESGIKLEFNKREIGDKIMIIYTDIYGNDFTEIIDVKESFYE